MSVALISTPRRKGALDLPAFCNALREIQYQAPISEEYDREVTVAEIRQGLASFSEAANQ